jgi:hypothetical protein
MSLLFELFKCETKADLEARAAAVTLTQEDLGAAILSTKLEGSVVQHIPVFRQFDPPHMKRVADAIGQLRAEDLKVGGPVPEPLLKMVRGIGQQRRYAGHFFWTPEYPWWWAINFELRDIRARDNHWQHGPHLHMLCWLTHPQTDPNVFINSMRNDAKPKLPHALHIRYKRVDFNERRDQRRRARSV